MDGLSLEGFFFTVFFSRQFPDEPHRPRRRRFALLSVIDIMIMIIDREFTLVPDVRMDHLELRAADGDVHTFALDRLHADSSYELRLSYAATVPLPF